MKLLSIFFAYSIILNCHANEIPKDKPTTPPQTEVKKGPQWPTPQAKKAYVWQLEKSGKKSYILGAIHLGVGADQLPSFIEPLRNEAKIVATEIDMSMDSIFRQMVLPSFDSPYSTKKLVDRLKDPRAKKAMNEILNSFKQEVGSDDWLAQKIGITKPGERIQDIIGRKTGMLNDGSSFIDHLSPKGFIYALMYQASAQQMSVLSRYENIPILDLAYGIEASASPEQTSVGLETLSEQAQIFEKHITISDIENLMLKLASAGAAGPISKKEQARLMLNEFKAAAVMYLQGDAEAYEAPCNADIGAIPALKEIRNQMFAKRIDALHECRANNPYYQDQSVFDTMDSSNKGALYGKPECKNEKVFAAVGMCHVVGKGSVLELLKNKGYKITRIATNEDAKKMGLKIPAVKKSKKAPNTDIVGSFQDKDTGEILENRQDVTWQDLGHFGVGDLEAFIGSDVAVIAGITAYKSKKLRVYAGSASATALVVALDGECRAMLTANNMLGGKRIDLGVIALDDCLGHGSELIDFIVNHQLKRMMSLKIFNF